MESHFLPNQIASLQPELVSQVCGSVLGRPRAAQPQVDFLELIELRQKLQEKVPFRNDHRFLHV